MRARPSSASKKPASSADTKASLRDDFRTYARAAILAAAEEELSHSGLHEARIEEIAERARVAVGTIYNLVGDREALVSEIISARQAEVGLLMKRTLAETQKLSFEAQLHAFVVAIFTYMREHRGFFRVVVEAQRAGAKSALRAKGPALDGIRSAYRSLVARGIKQRALKAAGRELYPVLLMGMVREVLFSDVETSAKASPEQRAQQITRVFLEGAGM